MNFSQTPPHRADLEQTILGAMLVDKTAYYLANEQQPLKAEDFYLHKNQVIYKCIQSLAQSNRDIDLITIISEIQKQSIKIEPYELVQLTNRVASAANLASWIMELKELSMRRELIRVSFEAHKKAFDMSQDALELISEAQAHTTNITDQLTGTQGNIKNTLSRLRERALNPKISQNLGKPIGIANLDSIINGGVEDEDFIILGGRPSQGKTALALKATLSMLQRGKEVAIYSYEMTEEQIMRRLLSMHSQIPQNKLKDGEVVEEFELLALENSLRFFDDNAHLIHFYDCAGTTVEVLKAKIKALKMRHKNLGFVVIDYIGLIGTQRFIRDKNERQEYIVNSLVNCRKALKIPFLVLSQLRKSVGKEIPTSADLLGAQAIEAGATKVLLMYKPDHYKLDKFDDGEDCLGRGEVHVCKNRDGVLGVARLYFAGSITTWSDERIEVHGVPSDLPF